jgi:hypothetical protein
LTREAVLELVFANEIFIAAADAPAPDITDFWLAEIFVSFSSCKIYGLSDWRGIFGFVALWSSALRNWRSEIGKRMFRFFATFFKDNRYTVDDIIYGN